MSTLTLDNIIYSYADGTSNVLNGISYDFQPGNFYAIVGQSGAGKSTLLGLLAGLDEPTGGQILFDDQNIADRGYSYHRKHTISLVFQRPYPPQCSQTIWRATATCRYCPRPCFRRASYSCRRANRQSRRDHRQRYHRYSTLSSSR